MDEVLELGLAASFESRSAVHAMSERAGERSSRIEKASLLVFVGRGCVEVDWRQAAASLDPSDALLLSARGSCEITYRFTDDAEWYALEYHHHSRRPSAHAGRAGGVEQVHVTRPERLTDLLRRYLSEHGRELRSPAILHCILQLLLAELRYSKQQAADAQCSQGVFEVTTSRVDAFIAAHYRDPISTFEIARALRYNPDYLERVYRQECRISIREAIQLRRIREARAQLLLQKNLSVSEIALMCGFNDTSFFRRAFKKAMNTTPQRYRAARKNLGASVAADDEPGLSAPEEEVALRVAPRPGRRAADFDSTNPIEPLNGGFFVSPGYGTHARRVLDTYELIFVTHGCLDLYEGDIEYHVKQNDALLLFPGRVHGGLRPFEPELTFYWVHFRLHPLRGANTLVRVPKLTRVRDPELLAELFCTFISDQESKVLAEDGASNLITLMLCAAAQRAGSAEAAPYRRPARRDRKSLAALVDDYIDVNYRRPISTAAIAEEMKFSPDYLERVYREYREEPILRALHHRRIRAAREFLRDANGKNINEIARECGYNDPGYFRRMFKRVTGLTPKQYRSMFVQTHINAH